MGIVDRIEQTKKLEQRSAIEKLQVKYKELQEDK